ncbi:MAG: orotate phosphoribosyltransferase [Cyanobacteria bacterium P01_E01_bin.34]
MLLLSRSPLELTLAEQKKALIYLLRQLAYREGDFTLSSGQKSTYYINCKPVTLHPQGAYLVGQLVLAELPENVEAVAGLTLGADPIVSAVSLASAYADRAPQPETLTNLPGLIVRKKAKGHGTQAYIEGPTLPANTCIWILEDVVTTGASALQAADRIADAGYTVGGILALVDRQQGGAQLYAEAKLPFKSLLTIADIQQAADLSI